MVVTANVASAAIGDLKFTSTFLECVFAGESVAGFGLGLRPVSGPSVETSESEGGLAAHSRRIEGCGEFTWMRMLRLLFCQRCWRRCVRFWWGSLGMLPRFTRRDKWRV